MGIKQTGTIDRTCAVARSALARMCLAAVLLTSVPAFAQDKPAQAQSSNDGGGFLAAVSRWWKEQTGGVNWSFEGARKKFEGMGRDAGDAAKSTVQGAKDAADAVARIPAARAVSGHEKCLTAPNGAPDCVAAANAMCKAKGFDSGKSVDMTTAENCPPKVYMSGRSTGPECTTETFVSRAFCQ